EGISPDSPLRMGQILSIPGILLGFYGLRWSLKNRLPAGWPGAEVDEDDDEGDDDEEDEDADDEGDDDDDAEDDAPEDEAHERVGTAPTVDPDVASEFGPDGRLKRQR